MLNFGHTIGHALETASQYTFPHGFAVAAGMQIESWLSFTLGHLSNKNPEDLELHYFPSSPSFPPSRKLFCTIKRPPLQSPFCLTREKIGSPLSFEGEFCQTVPEELIELVIYPMLIAPPSIFTHQGPSFCPHGQRHFAHLQLPHFARHREDDPSN